MSEKDTQHAADQLPKEVRDAFKGTPIQAFFDSRSSSATDTSDTNAAADDAHEELLKRIRGFSLKPREIRDHLDRFVIQQAEAKKVLSVAICDHYNHVRDSVGHPASTNASNTGVYFGSGGTNTMNPSRPRVSRTRYAFSLICRGSLTWYLVLQSQRPSAHQRS